MNRRKKCPDAVGKRNAKYSFKLLQVGPAHGRLGLMPVTEGARRAENVVPDITALELEKLATNSVDLTVQDTSEGKI